MSKLAYKLVTLEFWPSFDCNHMTSKLANQISRHIRLFFVLSLKLQRGPDSLSLSFFFVEIHKFVADFMQLIYDENFYEKLIYAWYSAKKCRSDATKYYDMVHNVWTIIL